MMNIQKNSTEEHEKKWNFAQSSIGYWTVHTVHLLGLVKMSKRKAQDNDILTICTRQSHTNHILITY